MGGPNFSLYPLGVGGRGSGARAVGIQALPPSPDIVGAAFERPFSLRRTMRVRSISLVLLTFATLSANHTLVHAQATNGQLKVLASNAFRAVVEELTPRCEEAIDDLGKTGKVIAASRVMLGRSGIGVGVRMGAVKPDIKTVDALKQTLLRAKAVSYAGDGASRPHIESMFDALGITKAMAAKSLLEQGSVRAAAKVASGDAELLLTLISEILPAPGLELVGPLPERFQHPVSFAAATGKSAAHADAAAALLKCLSAPDALAVLKSKGMER